MLMKLKYGKYLLCALLAIVFSGCVESEEMIPGSSAEPPYSIAIAVNGNSSMTRTAVIDPDNELRGKQHVTRVFLVIYKKESDTDGVCVAVEEVKWNYREVTAEGLRTREQNYTTEYQEYDDESKYLFLAMGFDDEYSESEGKFTGANSVAAYGLPDGTYIGKKLSERNCFQLKENADIKLITQSELFAGSQEFTGAQLKDGTAIAHPIELYRRVAGVAGYFKNLPTSMDGPNGVKKVATVVLTLYTYQNTKTYFLPECPAGYTDPEDVPDSEYIDCKTSPTNNYDYTETFLATYEVGSDEDDNGEFTLSAYVLPTKAPGMFDGGDTSTLQLTFYDTDGLKIAHRRILQRLVITRNGGGIIDETDEAAKRYPLRANHFYRIGEKNNPVDLGGDKGLNGTIYVEIDRLWDEYYGGSMDNDDVPPGLGIDKEWGEHDGGTLDGANQAD